MEKLVFDYTHCDYPEFWKCNKPFEYESKEKFILDVIDNPKLLEIIGVANIYDFEIEEGTIYERDIYKYVNKYVLTLEEWFDKNKCPHCKKDILLSDIPFINLASYKPNGRVLTATQCCEKPIYLSAEIIYSVEIYNGNRTEDDWGIKFKK